MIWKLITYLVRKLDPEKAHKISLFAFKTGRGHFSPNRSILSCKILFRKKSIS